MMRSLVLGGVLAGLLSSHQMGRKVAEAVMPELNKELERFGVRHEDRELRNVTYRISDGRFCIIDFEFATILDDGTGHAISLKPHSGKTDP